MYEMSKRTGNPQSKRDKGENEFYRDLVMKYLLNSCPPPGHLPGGLIPLGKLLRTVRGYAAANALPQNAFCPLALPLI